MRIIFKKILVEKIKASTHLIRHAYSTLVPKGLIIDNLTDHQYLFQASKKNRFLNVRIFIKYLSKFLNHIGLSSICLFHIRSCIKVFENSTVYRRKLMDLGFSCVWQFLNCFLMHLLSPYQKMKFLYYNVEMLANLS